VAIDFHLAHLLTLSQGHILSDFLQVYFLNGMEVAQSGFG